MVEPVGTTLGVIGLAGVFTTCVDCFEYIQFGRKFGADFSRCVLKLSIIRLKLSRWGASVDVNAKTTPPVDEKDVQAEEILAEIMQLFVSAEKKSLRFKAKAKANDLVVCDNGTDLEPSIESLRLKAKELAELRQKRTSWVKKTAWALYEKKAFEELIDNIKELVDDLVELFPAARESQREMSASEVAEFAKVDDGKTLGALKAAIGEDDESLLNAVEEKMALMAKGGHTWGETEVGDDALLNQGDQLGPGQKAIGNEHTFGKTKISGRAIANQGDQVGMGESFMKLALAARREGLPKADPQAPTSSNN